MILRYTRWYIGAHMGMTWRYEEQVKLLTGLEDLIIGHGLASLDGCRVQLETTPKSAHELSDALVKGLYWVRAGR